MFSDRPLCTRLDMIGLSRKKLEGENGHFIFNQFPFNENYIEVESDY